MFSLELEFHDGVSPTEVMFVRRPFAVIGTAEYAHVVIESGNPVTGDLRVTRGVGRSFFAEIAEQDAGADFSTGNAGAEKGAPANYDSEAEIDLGSVTARVISLDVDLQLLTGESPDQAGVRILRRALVQSTPMYPAVAVLGTTPIITSFPTEQGLLIGRSRSCGLRLDKADVSAEHAKIGFDRGRFWVEDLGSSNGTFVGGTSGERVTGRRFLEKSDRVSIGSEITLACVETAEDIAVLDVRGYVEKPHRAAQKTYPAVVSTSDLVRPSRFSFDKTDRAVIGRDPASDIWIAASHISRTHAELALRPDGKFDVIDMSSNGTFHNGERLPRGIPVTFAESLGVVDLNSGIQLGLVHSRDEEIRFLEGNIGGQATTMVDSEVIGEAKSAGERKRVLTPLEELELTKSQEQAARAAHHESRSGDKRYPWDSQTGVTTIPDQDDAQSLEGDGSGFQRLINRDSPGGVSRGPGEKFSAPRAVRLESEPRDAEEYDEPLLLYDPQSPALSRWIFIPSLALLIALIVAIWLADFG